MTLNVRMKNVIEVMILNVFLITLLINARCVDTTKVNDPDNDKNIVS